MTVYYCCVRCGKAAEQETLTRNGIPYDEHVGFDDLCLSCKEFTNQEAYNILHLAGIV